MGGMPEKDICATSVFVAIWLIGSSFLTSSVTSVTNCSALNSFVIR